MQNTLTQYTEHSTSGLSAEPGVTPGDDEGEEAGELVPCPVEYEQSVRSAFNADVTEYGGEVVNVNVTTDLGVELCLESLQQDFSWAVPASSHKNGGGYCEFVIDALNITGKIHHTGRIRVTTGGVTGTDILTAFRRVHSDLRSHGVETEWNPVTVTNLVVTFESLVDGRVNLTAVNIAFNRESQYEPEQFSGLVYSPDGSGTCLVFSTGTVNVTAVGSTGEAVALYEGLVAQFDEYGLLDA